MTASELVESAGVPDRDCQDKGSVAESGGIER